MKKITLLILLFFAKNFQSNAQIVYRDIPDGIPSGIDFNSDGTNEFVVSGGDSVYIYYFGLGANNNIHALNTTAVDVPFCVNAGFAVNATNNWVGAGDTRITGWSTNSNTNSSLTLNLDRYLAIRFNFAGSTNVYYGWIRFSVNNSLVATYKDYAYNSTPNQQILTGQTTLSNNKFSPIEYNVFPNPISDNFRIESNSLSTSEFKVSIVDIDGKLINLKSSDYLFDSSPLNPGIYFLKIEDNLGNSEIKKMIKK